MAPDVRVRSVRRVKLDRYGYDAEGRYYGIGLPVFTVELVRSELDFAGVEIDVRARDYRTLRRRLARDITRDRADSPYVRALIAGTPGLCPKGD